MGTRSIVHINNNDKVYTYYRHYDGYLHIAGQNIADLLKTCKNSSNFLNLISDFAYNDGDYVYEHRNTHNFSIVEYDYLYENYNQEYTYNIIFSKDENNKIMCDLTAYDYDMDILYNDKNYKNIIADNFLNYCKQQKR